MESCFRSPTANMSQDNGIAKIIYTRPRSGHLSNAFRSFHFSSTINKNNISPHNIKFQLAPCHNPVNIQTQNRFRYKCFLLPPSGIYTYSRSQLPRVICHRLQNSVMEQDRYGSWKLSGKSKPIIRPSPFAIREYP